MLETISSVIQAPNENPAMASPVARVGNQAKAAGLNAELEGQWVEPFYFIQVRDLVLVLSLALLVVSCPRLDRGFNDRGSCCKHTHVII